MMHRAVAAAALGFCLAAPAAADPNVSARYQISIAGIDIGESTLTYREVAGRYEYTLDGGFAFLFFDGAAAIRADGARGAGGFQPETYALVFEGPTRDVKINVDYGAGGPKTWALEPPPEPEWLEDRVPLAKSDLFGAVDPLTAFLIQAKSVDEACAHNARVFTGFVRFDVALSTRKIDPTGIAECAVSYQPVSGHRRNNDGVRRLQSGGLTVSLFELAEGVWAPHRLGLSTSLGTLEFLRAE